VAAGIGSAMPGSAVPIRNRPLGPITCSFLENRSSNSFTLNTALPLVLCNKPGKVEVDWMSGNREKYNYTHTVHTETPSIIVVYTGYTIFVLK